MAKKPLILCVDDEKNVVESIRLNLRARYEVLTALSAKEGLEVIAARPDICVVVSDMRMPSVDGAAFLSEVKQQLPCAVRMLLTGYSDIEAAMRAVNDGQIFRFLAKPCPPDQLMSTIDAGVVQHRLIVAEKELLQETLVGCARALIDVLALSNPMALGRAERVRDRARTLAIRLNVDATWRVEFAALLSQLGMISLPDDTIRKLYDGDDLESSEINRLVANMDAINKILANIPRMEPVISLLGEVAILTGQAAVGGAVQSRSLESRIVQCAIDLDSYESRGLSFEQSVVELHRRSEILGDDVLGACPSLAERRAHRQVSEVQPTELTDGMVLCDDLKTANDVLVMPRGFAINRASREHIMRYVDEIPATSISVLVPSADTPENGSGAQSQP